MEAEHPDQLPLREDGNRQVGPDAALQQGLSSPLRVLLGDLGDARKAHHPGALQLRRDPALSTAIRLPERVGPRGDAGRLPLEGAGGVALVGERGDEVGPVGAGQASGQLETAPDARVDAVRALLHEDARELRDLALEVQAALQVQLALVTRRHVAHHDRQPALAARDLEALHGGLEPAPVTVAVADPIGERGRLLRALEPLGEALAQAPAVLGVHQVPERLLRQLVSLVAAELLEVRAQVEHPTVLGHLADRVLGLVGEEAEALIGVAAPALGAQAADGVAQHLGHELEPRDLGGAPGALLAHAEEVQEAHRPPRHGDRQAQVGERAVALEVGALGLGLGRQVGEAPDVEELAA